MKGIPVSESIWKKNAPAPFRKASSLPLFQGKYLEGITKTQKEILSEYVDGGEVFVDTQFSKRAPFGDFERKRKEGTQKKGEGTESLDMECSDVTLNMRLVSCYFGRQSPKKTL